MREREDREDIVEYLQFLQQLGKERMDDQLLNKAFHAIGGPVELNFHFLNNVWASCLAVTGLLDFLTGYVLPDLVKPHNAANDDRNNAAPKKMTSADDPSSSTPLFSKLVR